MSNILLVEDNKALQKNNKEFLEEVGGYSVYLAMSIGEARAAIRKHGPDLIVLDIMLPDGSGLDFLREYRLGNTDTPVILLTALSEHADEVRGIREGGDDYIAKPYDSNVLLARIESLLTKKKRSDERVQQAMETANIAQYGALAVHHVTQRAYLNGEDVNLGQKEFLLLAYFLKNLGRKLTLDELYEAVWGQEAIGSVDTVKVRISTLRKKLKTEQEIAVAIDTVERKYYVCRLCLQ